VSPYIHQEQRECYENYELQPPEDGAALNFIACRLMSRFIDYHGLRYTTIAQVRDAFNGALNEFERCVAGPYEQIKREQNGDVWGECVALLEGMMV